MEQYEFFRRALEAEDRAYLQYLEMKQGRRKHWGRLEAGRMVEG